ncbi:MAG: HIRAN domain-containing protein [Burkholderiales bacterium]|nr:HIRAN domain-containing protein [Burkholderiales bacterium]
MARTHSIDRSPAPAFRALLAAAVIAASPVCTRAQTTQARIIVQSSPLAGFRHYEAPNLWGEIRPGDPLALVREPENPHDRNAVRVEWRSFKLGYVPRAQNEAVARQLDRGTPLTARVSKVQSARAPNRRVEFEIYLPL